MPKPPRKRPASPAPAAATPGRPGGLDSPLAASPGFLVRLAQLRAFDEFHRSFAGLGITPAGYGVLALVAANPGVRPGAIAEELRVKPSNIAVLVNNLVAAGLVERSTDEAELRASLLHLTEKGRAAWAEMERIHEGTDARFAEALSPAERRHFVGLLQKLLQR
ncbi:MarR family winged helix-turn-helix transcriptional regulator [Roseomonas sp. GC11]|uniref:MarR family winged helix-turn-helix transcriptional regulator n=1 Tax=Roseomonas sp. GC11 TaxID=2950546 RepID=UPI00210D4F97|nr:MarR family winged helix-turn-helix transcriptional regulator [Roseomonas sp. GC11]MCQ4160034.1 MarR family winged helix-turn-helix transcriptional regulator [Roseomonas sp. GC11]